MDAEPRPGRTKEKWAEDGPHKNTADRRLLRAHWPTAGPRSSPQRAGSLALQAAHAKGGPGARKFEVSQEKAKARRLSGVSGREQPPCLSG